MALYESLTSESTPEQIAEAYKEYTGMVGGDTQAAQESAVNYLTNLGISAPTITAAYNNYLSPAESTGALPQTSTSNSYFQANPDVAAAYAQNTYGMTPEQFAQAHYQNYGQNEGRASPLGQVASDTGPTLNYYTGKQYQGNQVLDLAKQLAGVADLGALRGGAFGTQGQSIGFDYDQAQKLLGTDPTAAQQVFLDAAANLIDKGVTSLDQLKAGDIMGQANVRPETDEYGNQTGRYIATWGGDYEGNNQNSRVLTPEEAAKVVSKEVWGGDDTYTAYEPINTAIGKGIYDANGKLISDTGQLSIGETYTGPGGTQYHLTFNEQGKPVFSTSGVSTSDAGSIGALLSVASLIPGAAPFTMAANAALAAANNNPLGALASLSGIPGVSDFANPQLISALQTANQVNNLVNAYNKGDIFGLLGSGAALAGPSGLGSTKIGDTNITVSDAMKAANLAKAVASGDPSMLSRAISMFGNLPKGTSTKVSADDTGGLPGLNLAAADSGIMSDAGSGLRAEITGAPIYAEDPRSAKVSPPPGYTLASSSDPVMNEPARYDDNDNILPKSDGTYYDFTQNAWFKPSGEFDLSNIADYSKLFDGQTLPGGFSVGNGLLGEDVGTTQTPGSQMPDGVVPTDLGELVIPGKRIPTDIPDLGEIVISGERIPSDIPDLGEIIIPGERIPSDVVTEPETPTPDAKTPPPEPKNPPVVNPPVVTPPSTKVTPKTVTQTQFAPPQDMKFLEVKNPWLVTKRTPQKGVKEQELKQLYDQLDPELKDVLSAKPSKEDDQLAALKESLDPELLAMLGYASGGSAGSFSALSSFQDSMKDATPKFVKYTDPGFLRSSANKKSPIQMQELPQMQLGKKLARGGLPGKYAEAAPDGHNPEFITGVTGYYAGGRGTGQSDDIPAMLHDGDYVIDAEAVSALGDGSSKAGKDVLSHFMGQVPHKDGAEGKPVPAKIADGEFVLPEAFVTALGGGDNKRGAHMLDEMRENLRQHKRSAPTSKIPPKAKSPLDYLKGVKG